ncbi:1587_t:CDS:2, partial [Acaulospora morrowiae]
VYACALIFWEIVTWAEQGYPYQNLSEHQLYEAVRDKGLRPPTDALRKYPQLLELVEEMWKKDPAKATTEYGECSRKTGEILILSS